MNIKSTLVAISAAMAVVPIAAADQRDDAAAIARVMLSDEVVSVQFGSIEPMLRDTLKVNFSAAGTELSESGFRVLTEMYLEEFVAIFSSEVRVNYADALLKHLEPDEITSLRSFLESDEGKSFGEKQVFMATDMSKSGMNAGAVVGNQVANRLRERIKGEDGYRFSESDYQALLNEF